MRYIGFDRRDGLERSDSCFQIVALKRRWVPEWLWRLLGQLPVRRPWRWLFTTDRLDDITWRRVNGGGRR